MNRSTDPWIIAVVALLIGIGLVMVYSASAVVAAERSGSEAYFFTRQVAALVVGLGIGAATALAPMKLLRRHRWALYVACLVGLVLCFVPGIQHRANGASRWLGFGSLHLQPSEFAKIAVLVVLADWLDRNRGHLGDWRMAVKALLIPAPVLVLVFIEPDFGTTAIIAGLSLTMLFVAGLRPLHMAVVGGAALALGVPLLLVEQYRLRRLTSFLDPWSASEGEGYHVIQSWIAMHSGGMWGQGLGNSLAKLHFLPEPWTDFIGAVIAEELGLAGLLVLLGLYCVLVWRGVTIARRARDAFGMFLAAALTAMLGLQAAFNLAVVMGAVPPKGLVLPFVSYGASALMAHVWSVGILLSVAAEADTTPVAQGWGASPERRPARAVIVRNAVGRARPAGAAIGGPR